MRTGNEIVQIGEICSLVKGTYPTLKTEPGKYPLVVTAEFRRSASSYQLEGPAVCIPLISSTGHGDAAINRLHYQEGKFALANLLLALLPKDPERSCAKYLYYLLTAKKDTLLVPLMQGTANVSLKEKDIAAVSISLPPIAEQHRIVERIEELTQKAHSAQKLRKQAAESGKQLLIGMAHGADMGTRAREQCMWRQVRLKDILTLSMDLMEVVSDTQYPNFGIYSFGRGLFSKPPISGFTTSAQKLNRVRKGQFIYSRLFAFEGAYGMVDEEFDGYFVSNEYPTFDCDRDVVSTEFLHAYFMSPGLWEAIAAGSKGLGDRRQRVQPQQLLEHQLMLPSMEWQQKVVSVYHKIRAAQAISAELDGAMDTLIPSILTKTFQGEL